MTVTAESSDVYLDDPVTVIESTEFPGWEFVVHLTREQTVSSLAVQTAGTWWHGVDPSRPPPSPLPAGGVTARFLRVIPLGALASEAIQNVRRRATDAKLLNDAFDDRGRGFPGAIDSIEAWHEALTTRPGRRGRPDRDYLALAIEYAELAATGDRTPIATLARQHHLAQGTVRNLVLKARQRGLLTGQRGRAGGVLTSKARDMLGQQEGEQDV